MSAGFDSIDAIAERLAGERYVCERSLATTIYLALELGKPLFLEGEAGVGKTEVGKVLARITGGELIRLQCYEGLDVHSAVYEWNYSRQMLEIRRGEATGELGAGKPPPELFGREFLLERPLLKAIESRAEVAPVLLIDELDRADEEFEAFLLEILSDFQISIPEIGTLAAERPPVVVITSNRTREVHDALRRRCLYHWIDYPDFDKELAILLARAPDTPASLSRQIVAFVQELRTGELYKRPGVSETLDWARALTALDQTVLDESVVEQTLGVLLKYQDDLEEVRRGGIEEQLARALVAV